MRVVLDGRCIQDHFPGIGRYAFNLARHLSRRQAGADELIVLVDPAAPNRWHDLSSLARSSGLTPRPVHAPIFSALGLLLLSRELRRLRPDVYHAPYYVYPLVGSAKAVVNVFDLIPAKRLDGPPTRRWLRRFVYRLAVGSGTRRAARVVVPSEATRRDLTQLHQVDPGRVLRIPLGVDPTFREIARTEIVQVRERFGLPPRFILTVGINKPHKNHEGLVRALPSLPADVTLVVAGPRDCRFPDAGDFATRHGIADRVRLLGGIGDADLPALYAAAEVLVYPSFDEGFGLPPLEAMACGTPVACSDRGSLPEVAGDAAALFDPARPEELAAVLVRLLADSTERDRRRHAGLERVKAFTWDDVAKATWQAYRETMNA